MRQFKRKARNIETDILLVGAIIVGLLVVYNGFTMANFEAAVKLWVAYLVFMAVMLLAFVITPPNMDYTIIRAENYMVFKMNEDDKRRLGRNFDIVSKTRNYLTLDDGISRICIPYNKEVVQFLEEIQI